MPTLGSEFGGPHGPHGEKEEPKRSFLGVLGPGRGQVWVDV